MHYNNQYNVIGQDTDTYYLLRDENKKIDFWKDLKLVKQKADKMKIEI